MNDQPLEQRVLQLERQLASLERRYLAHMRTVHGTRTAELEAKVENLEARLQDVDKIEKLTYDAYAQTHPEALKAMLEADRVIYMGLDIPHSLSNRKNNK